MPVVSKMDAQIAAYLSNAVQQSKEEQPNDMQSKRDNSCRHNAEKIKPETKRYDFSNLMK